MVRVRPWPALLARHPKHLFFVIGDARTGTSLLCDYLASVREAKLVGEVLNPENVGGLSASHKGLAVVAGHIRRCMLAEREPWVGAKLHFGHLADRNVELPEFVARFPEAKYLILFRESLANQYVSLQTARATGQWSAPTQDTRPAVDVAVNPADVEKRCQLSLRAYRRALDIPWSEGQCCMLTYEQLAEHRQELFRRFILPFLGIPVQPVTTTLVKQAGRPLSERVSNYAAAARALERWQRVQLSVPPSVLNATLAGK